MEVGNVLWIYAYLVLIAIKRARILETKDPGRYNSIFEVLYDCIDFYLYKPICL